MPAAPFPDNELLRRQALAALDVLDSEAEPEFDALVQAAALICDMPVSLVSLIDADRQWFKASTGLAPDTRETPREHSFCAHAILAEGVFEVPDACEDARFADNPLVLGEPRVRFYAGAPLRLASGALVGTLCVIDHKPRQLSERQRALLQQLSAAAVKALEGRRAMREHGRALAALAQSDARFHVLCDASPLGMFATDAAGICTYTNARWQAIHGQPAAAALGHDWLHPVHPLDREAAIAARQFSALQGAEFDREFRVLRPDGEVVRVHVLKRPILDDHGTVTGFVGSVDDVTARSHAERTLREERERLASIIEGTGAGTWEWHVQTGASRYNEKWAAILGHTLDDLGPTSIHTFRDRAHPDDMARSNALLQAHFSGQSPAYECEIRLRHRDGHWVWILTRGRVLTWTDDGQPEWMFGTHMDLSVRKQQEEALRKSEAFLNRTGDVAGVGGWELDLDARRLHWSPPVRRLLGVGPDHEPDYEESFSRYAPEAQPVIQAAAERAIAQGQDWDLELPVIRADGRRIWVRVVGHAEFEGGRAVRLLGAFQDITEKIAQRQVIERANQRIELATASGGIGIWEFDFATQQISLDAWGCRAYGESRDQLVMSLPQWLERVHPADRDAARQAAERALGRGDHPMDIEFRILWADGSVHHLRATGRKTRDAETGGVRLVGANWDVTPLRQLGAQLAEQHELLRVTLESIGDAVLTTDAAGQVTWLNPVAERLTGWPTADAKGRPLAQVFRTIDEATREPSASPVAACLAKGAVVADASNTLLISRAGQAFGIEDSAAPIRDAGGVVIGVVLVFHDVTEQRRLAREMSYRAMHDALTGLVNRSEFEARLTRLLDKARGDQSAHALLYIDLDQFKLVNDACGHSVGDQLLQQLSKLLMESVRSRDTLARLGGDEFAIILEHCPAEQAELVAQKICDRMDDFRFVHDARRFRLGTSIGLVPIDARWASAAAVMQAADTSCYAAKDAGRNRVHVWYDTDLAMQARHGEMKWATRLEQALDENRFVLFAQRLTAINPLRSHGGIHAEALLRMVDADGSLVAPGAFLPAAERFHLATHIDRWVLRRAVDWLLTLDASARLETLCINLSGQSIGDRAFHRYATQILAEAGAATCERICLEITETAAVTNLGDAALFIKEVRRFGVQIALDDFGAGASSFGYLKTLAVDVLKIDGQFITHLLDDPLDDAAVRCFVDVARVCGLKTVAEFVDSPAVLERLREIGVDYAQGYLLHRPEPIERLVNITHPAAQAEGLSSVCVP